MTGVSKYDVAWQEQRLKEDEAKLSKLVSSAQALDRKVRVRKNWIKLLKEPRFGLLP